MKRYGAVLAFLGAISLVAMSAPDVKVEIKGLHLCCGGCSGAATGAINGAGGKDAKADQGSGTITFSASNEKNAQKALDALAKAGFWGDTGNKQLCMKDDSGTVVNPKKPAPKVMSLTFSGVHNCCGGCAKGIKAALAKCEGYESDDVKDKEGKFTVKGNFDAAAMVKALNDGGYHGTIAK
ncbi:MAG TPA: heavy metal-associated domain-containing protein [Planctomycetota bacterium]|nr:heavy metal-associated domain-containing protein [Planctomycetota bacterium]